MVQQALRAAVIAVLALLFSLSAADAVGPEQAGTERWVVLAARQDQVEAVDLARSYARGVDGVRVVRAKNGWYAIVVGPLRAKTIAEARVTLESRVDIPSDAYLGRIDQFPDLVFTAPSSPILATIQYRGEVPSITHVGPLTVVLDNIRSGDGVRKPITELRLSGASPFRVPVAKDLSFDTATYSGAKVVRLDPSRDIPQVVLTFYTGGAHCCTVTRIATRTDAGPWAVVDGLTLDADGYEFEDVDGDGSVELVTFDDSFLYEFESYAGSFAPSRVYRLSGETLKDVTAEPAIRPFLLRQLRWMEAFAVKDQKLWSNNGFLAGWVAAKAQLGEVDEAWARMLGSYDHNPMFGPEQCTIQLPVDKCPADRLYRSPFPDALRTHLVLQGYAVPPVPSAPPPVPAASAAVPSHPPTMLSGTGFYITAEGHLLTNAHVVENCKTISVTHAADEPVPAKLVALDATNDLAILSTSSKPEAVASFRFGIRLGEEIAAYGFPLTGILSSGGNFTLGNVTALTGVRDDSRLLQFSAPVQPGNSGGPLLDETGLVVGVVVSKLNAMKLAMVTDDLAQNINFAIKASTAEMFAEAQGIDLNMTGQSGAALRPADLADKAKSISAHLLCTR